MSPRAQEPASKHPGFERTQHAPGPLRPSHFALAWPIQSRVACLAAQDEAHGRKARGRPHWRTNREAGTTAAGDGRCSKRTRAGVHGTSGKLPMAFARVRQATARHLQSCSHAKIALVPGGVGGAAGPSEPWQGVGVNLFLRTMMRLVYGFGHRLVCSRAPTSGSPAATATPEPGVVSVLTRPRPLASPWSSAPAPLRRLRYPSEASLF